MSELAVGDTIRIIRDTFGFRESAMYSAIDVKANSYAVVVVESPGSWGETGNQKAAVLRYVKKHKAWKKTKVIITFREDYVFDGGEGNRWVRTGVLDELALI